MRLTRGMRFCCTGSQVEVVLAVLGATQRNEGLIPAVKANKPLLLVEGALQQVLVSGHVEGAAEGIIQIDIPGESVYGHGWDLVTMERAGLKCTITKNGLTNTLKFT